MNTTVKIKDTKYGKMFSIWKVLGVSLEGEEITPERPEIQFGIKKAKLVQGHLSELDSFVSEES